MELYKKKVKLLNQCQEKSLKTAYCWCADFENPIVEKTINRAVLFLLTFVTKCLTGS